MTWNLGHTFNVYNTAKTPEFDSVFEFNLVKPGVLIFDVRVWFWVVAMELYSRRKMRQMHTLGCLFLHLHSSLSRFSHMETRLPSEFEEFLISWTSKMAPWANIHLF